MTTSESKTAATAASDDRDVVMWLEIEDAPHDGTPIVGNYGSDGEAQIFWSDRPVCMLGTRCGGFSEGWATCGNDTDYNLPMDAPISWCEDT